MILGRHCGIGRSGLAAGRLEGGGGQEPIGHRHQFVQAAMEAIGGHGILEQTPDALDRIVLMRRVFGQPQQANPRVLGPRQPTGGPGARRA